MKKLIAVVATALMALSLLAGCGAKQSPSDAVSEWMEAFKSGSVNEASSISASLAGASEEDMKLFLKKAQDLDYEIVEEKLADDGKSATVKVKITTYDFGAGMTNFVDKMMQDAMSGKITEKDVTTEKLISRMIAEMTALEDKDYEKEVVANLTLDDKTWKPDIESNAEFLDAVLGGLLTAAKDMQS